MIHFSGDYLRYYLRELSETEDNDREQCELVNLYLSLMFVECMCFVMYVYFKIKRTTCIMAQKWPPTKLAHIVKNNSCVVPLTETGMETGDRLYILELNGVKGYDT